MELGAQIALQLILILINAFFAASEMALISVKRPKIEQMAGDAGISKRKRSAAKKLLHLTGDSARFLATIQVGITLAGFLGSAFAADNFAVRLSSGLLAINPELNPALIRTVSVIIITIILSFLTLILGELAPKQIALRYAERIAFAIAGSINMISLIFRPMVVFLSASTALVLRLFGIRGGKEGEKVTEEEIRLLVDASSKDGSINSSEKEIIHNVFEFNDRTVNELMTHRTEADILYLDESEVQWQTRIEETRHSFYPVCGKDSDDIRGVLKIKDYFRLQTHEREAVLRAALKDALLVPDTLKADALFRKMKKKQTYFALALDEYGSFVGLVTMNDLLEQIVGSLSDESEGPGGELLERDEKGAWHISGEATLDRVSRALNVSLPEEKYDNFSSYLFNLLGEVPEDGFTAEVLDEEHGLRIRIDEVRERFLERATVTRL
jgi:putative hemolysin